MEELKETIIEAREELMVSLTGDANPTLRTAHFLKPTVPSIAQNIPKHPSLSKFSSFPSTFEPNEWPLSITFHGWRGPQRKWEEWVEKMAALHESTWKNAGIYQAVMSSTYRIQRNNGLILGVAERWYPKTNTFVFPWGEATITLEDMQFAGYSVLGSPVFSPLETDDFEELELKLLEVMTILRKTKAKKADHSAWIGYFMGNKSEFEHEAFLSLWLSRFVFPSHSYGMISKNVFPIAIRLARGIKVALAPALLASIYRDLSLLKGKILALSKMEAFKEPNDDWELEVTIWSPFQIVQVWVWERFPKLQPKPNLCDSEAPRLARWHNVTNLKLGNARLALESEARFQWLPYSTSMDSLCNRLYDEKEKSVSTGGYFDEELESFARFVRACELVGIGCIELYCPHRVAMQFGVDQDLPAPSEKSNATQEIVWRSYDRPIKDAMLYIPSRHSNTNVTLRYLKWWKQSMLSGKDASCGSPMSSKTALLSPDGKDIDHDASCPPGFNPKRRYIEVLDSDEEDDLTVKELLNRNGKRKLGETGMDCDWKLSSATAQGLSPSVEDNDDVIVTNPMENNIKYEPRSGKERTITMEDTSKTRVEDSPSPVQNAGYDRPIKDAMLYIPSRHSNTNVSLRYLKWWKQSMLSGKDASCGSPMSSKTALLSPDGKDIDHDASCPPGFSPKRRYIEVLDSDEEDDLTVKELLTRNGKRKIGETGMDCDWKLSSATAQGLSPSVEDNDDVIVTNPTENNIKNEPRSGKERTITMEDTSKTRVEDSPSPVQNAGSLQKDKAPRSRSSFDIQTDGLVLEARIMKLRKEVDELKAAIFGQR